MHAAELPFKLFRRAGGMRDAAREVGCCAFLATVNAADVCCDSRKRLTHAGIFGR